MNIAIISLGCPKNQVDADVFCHALIKAGHQTVADPEQADIIIVNTCGFIESAKTEAIENILEACAYKQQNPDYDPWEEPWENSSSPVDLGLTKDAEPEADATAAAPAAEPEAA